MRSIIHDAVDGDMRNFKILPSIAPNILINIAGKIDIGKTYVETSETNLSSTAVKGGTTNDFIRKLSNPDIEKEVMSSNPAGIGSHAGPPGAYPQKPVCSSNIHTRVSPV